MALAKIVIGNIKTHEKMVCMAIFEFNTNTLSGQIFQYFRVHLSWRARINYFVSMIMALCAKIIDLLNFSPEIEIRPLIIAVFAILA